MRRELVLGCTCLAILSLPGIGLGRPVEKTPEIVEQPDDVDRVGDVHGNARQARKVLQDTTWIADWSFDGAGGVCDDSGWTRVDRRILIDGNVYWNGDDDRFDGMGGFSGQAAVLAAHDFCWAFPDGYANDWYQALVIEYTGVSYLSFDYLLDSEQDFDFMRVEVDSACSSFDQVDYDIDPRPNAAKRLRGTPLFEASGFEASGHVESLELSDFGTSTTTHCAYISFFSDGGWSPADGLQPTTLGIAMAVDNLQLTGSTAFTEDFEAAGTMHPALSFADIQDANPFGLWARLYEHVTDNDPTCTENRTCAWLFSDDTTPTISTSQGYGPGGFVLRAWLDNEIISPWVSLAGTQSAAGTVLTCRAFGGNPTLNSRIFMNTTVRVRKLEDNTDTPAPGDSIECVSKWGDELTWIRLNSYTWINHSWDEGDLFRFIDPADATHIQVRFRIRDLQPFFGAPSIYESGPGPYIDRVRIGRRMLTGPIFTTFIPAQDAFPTEIDPNLTPGEHFRPTTDRFGTCAFSMSIDLDDSTPRLVTGDSIVVRVRDLREAGGITSVEWYGAIVSGPHAGKAPPPWTVGTNGFFLVQPDSLNFVSWAAVDLDDDYFRGGDVLRYFWIARDAQGGFGSSPEGLTSVPSSLADAEAATGGLWEVSFLPTIDWDPAYVARVAADPHGKLEPTSAELANSTQANAILYNQIVNTQRRSGDANRTSFMYTLDRLGYQGEYDVYDKSVGTNNQLGGRATIEQAQGYSILIQDTGLCLCGSNLPDGSDPSSTKIDQIRWYRDWLASSSAANPHTLWLIGARLPELAMNTPLVSDMGVSLTSQDILPVAGANPDVQGVASFTFANGNSVDFSNDAFTVLAGCPAFPPYNGIEAIAASGTAAVTHRWMTTGGGLHEGAIVMNANPSQSWNTIMQLPTWQHITGSTPASLSPEERLAQDILHAVLSPDDLQSPDPATDVGEQQDPAHDLPRTAALYPNVPNPFNPATTIRFDLARDSHVELRIYNAAGRLVRTLVHGPMPHKNHALLWDGRDDTGMAVPSGIYLYRLETADFLGTRKMILLR